MTKLRPFEIIMRIDFVESKGPEVTCLADRVQELVRCKDCKYGEYRESFDEYVCHETGCGYDGEWFCAGGERKEQERAGMSELKPCPFCGGDAELLTLSGIEQGLSPVDWYVVCTNGCARTFRHISDHDAIEAWNRRAET